MYYSQRDARWANKKVGFGTMTFAQVGCALTSIANVLKFYGDDKTPLEINEIAKNCGAFNVDMLNFPRLASALGYDYLKVPSSNLEFPKISQKLIAETDYYKKVAPQHFFFYNPGNKKRIDPLDLEPSWEENNYPIVSYRILTPKPLPENATSPQDVPEIPQSHPTPTEPEKPAVSPPVNAQNAPISLWQKILQIILNFLQNGNAK